MSFTKRVGAITESDVLLATASDAVIVGFNVRPSLQASRLAENEGVEIKTYSIIYNAIEEMKSAMEGMLEPKIQEKVVANVEVRNVFKFDKATVAGCYVLEGKINRNAKVRLVRDGIVIYPTGEGAICRTGLAETFQRRCERSAIRNGMRFDDQKLQRYQSGRYRRSLRRRRSKTNAGVMLIFRVPV